MTVRGMTDMIAMRAVSRRPMMMSGCYRGLATVLDVMDTISFGHCCDP